MYSLDMAHCSALHRAETALRRGASEVARRGGVTICFRLNPVVAAALGMLAKAEGRTRTSVVTQAISHYMESFYPTTRKLENQLGLIELLLKSWAVVVRSEVLWADEHVRNNAASKLDEAANEAFKLALYRGGFERGEVGIRIHRLAARISEAKAMQLEKAGREAILETVVIAENDVQGLKSSLAQLSREKQDTQGRAEERLAGESE